MKNLILLTITLLFISCSSPLMKRVDFEKEKKLRFQKVIDKLIIIRDAELDYRNVNGKYTDDKNELIKFIDKNEKDIFKVPYTDKEFEIKVGIVEKIKGLKAPVFEVKIDKSSVLVGLDPSLIREENHAIGPGEIRGEFISVGSITELKESGNWPYFYDEIISSYEWRSPRGNEFTEFGRIIVKNNIKVCGEYKVKEIDSGEFILACTSDGYNWNYFVVYKNIKKIYRANDEMIKGIEAPR